MINDAARYFSLSVVTYIYIYHNIWWHIYHTVVIKVLSILFNILIVLQYCIYTYVLVRLFCLINLEHYSITLCRKHTLHWEVPTFNSENV